MKSRGKKSGDKNLEVIRHKKKRRRRRHKIYHQGVNTHRERRHPRAESGTNTSLKEKGSTVLNVPLHKSIFLGRSSIH